MSEYIPWNSQPLSEWAAKFAPGKIININGQQTHYIEKGEGEPVILIHGFFFDTCMWDKNIDALAEKFKVYALDLWGSGYSSRQPMDYGYPLFTKQLRGFLEFLNIQKASFAGQSMGAGTIINFTLSNRENVDKIILVDAAGLPNTLPILGRISNLPLIGELLYALRGNFIRKMTLGKTFIHRKELLTKEFIENATRYQKIEGTSKGMLYITRKQFFDTLQEEITALARMNVPTLIVWGRQETAIPLSNGRKMHQILKGSRLEIIDQAGHCSNIDQPEKFNSLALDFLTGS